MIYLLAKYTLLFLVASLFGYILGYWWSRRSMVDVTESYDSLRKASERTDRAEWTRLWSRMDEIPESVTPAFSAVNARIDQLSESVANIPRPTPPRDIDLAPVEQGLADLRQTVNRLPVVKTNPAVDLSPIDSRLGKLEQRIADLPRPEPIDLHPIDSRLGSLEQRIADLPPPKTVDLTPIDSRLGQLDQRIADLPHPDSLDLAPVHSRLDSIEDEIRSLAKRLKAEPLQTAVPATTRTDEPVILSAALYGNKDDLKQISGVGPKLEQLLNKNGVYYFWQVASWNSNDIDFIDDRLDVFKGRIARDNWVDQAKQHSQEPGAASIPAS